MDAKQSVSKVMECHTLMSAKQRVQNHFRNKSTSDLTLLGGFLWLLYVAWPETESLSTKLFVLLLGPFWPSSRGHVIMSSILCKNRVLMVHQLILFRIC